MSDHALVLFHLPLRRDSPSLAERLVRGWRRIDREKLRHERQASPLSTPPSADADVEQLSTTYDTMLRDIADRLVPSRTIYYRAGRPTPWVDAEYRAVRPVCRRLERLYRRTRRPDGRLA